MVDVEEMNYGWHVSRVLRVVEAPCTEATVRRHSCSSKTTFFNFDEKIYIRRVFACMYTIYNI